MEKWIPHTKRRKDLYDIFDIIAVPQEYHPLRNRYNVIGVQTTTASHIKSRLEKIKQNPHTMVLLRAGWGIVIHGWKKNRAGKWELVQVNVGDIPRDQWTT